MEETITRLTPETARIDLGTFEREPQTKLDELRAALAERKATERELWADLELNRKAGDKLASVWLTANADVKMIEHEIEIEEAVIARIGGNQ